MNNNGYAKIHVWSFGLALGILWGGSLLISGLIAMTTGIAEGFVDSLGTMYLGYQSTIVGSLIGGAWGFFDMFLGGVLIAFLYNFFLSRSASGT